MSAAAFDRAVLHLRAETVAAATRREAAAYCSSFDDLEPYERDAFGHLVLKWIEQTDDWPTWGWASNRTPWSYVAAGGEVLARALDQSARERPRPASAAPDRSPDHQRSMLTSICFKLLRKGLATRELLSEIHAANDCFYEPLATDAVNALVEWCAGRQREKSHA